MSPRKIPGPCPVTGCPNLAGQCVKHQRQAEKQRGTRQQRGYEAQHDAERKAWAPIVATGTVKCRRAPYGRCLAPDPIIRPDEPWQLGHPDADCPAPKAPEHRRCNVSTAPRKPGRKGRR